MMRFVMDRGRGSGGGAEPLPSANGRLLCQSIKETLPNSPSQLLSHLVITSPTNFTSYIHTLTTHYVYHSQYIIRMESPLRVTVNAFGTASRNAVGVSRHPNTRIDPELQAPPSYPPCFWHCLQNRRRRFEAPQQHTAFPNRPSICRPYYVLSFAF